MTTTTQLARRLWPVALAASIAAVALALWLAAPGSTQGLVEKPAPLGLVGLNGGQTLHVSIANIVGFDPQPDPPGCLLRVGFVDAQNNRISDPSVLALRPGVARSFDYQASGDPSVRQYIRPVVVDVRPRGDCPAVVTGELLDRGSVNGIVVIGGVPVNAAVFAK
jgi:hypothetical protein